MAIIGIDFDGTCVTHEFPKVGKDIGAQRVLKRLTDAGHKLILFTMRSHRRTGTAEPGTLGYDNPENIVLETDPLQDAINWFAQNDIPLYGINENPGQHTWTDSPKPYCHLYIDDSAIGCPLIHDLEERPYIDWVAINHWLKMDKYY